MTTATITQTGTVADAAPGWTVPLGFDQFNPSAGMPLDVQVGLVGTVTGSVSIENLGATAATVVVSFPSLFSVTGAGGVPLTSVAVDPWQTIQLGAYDGSTDFGGGSGTMVPVISSTGSAAAVYTPGTAGAVAFVGTGALHLTVSNSATSAVTGNDNLLAVTHAEAGASVSVQYDYETVATGGGGGVYGGGVQTSGSLRLKSDLEKTTAVQTLVISDRKSGWNTSVVAKQFDPALGTLIAVNETLIADLNGWFAAENLSSATGAVNMTDTGNVALTLPGGPGNISVMPSIGSGVSLGAFDGASDFAGRSGFAQGGLVNTGVTWVQLDAFSADLSSFIGGGTVGLAVSSLATSVVTGPADLESELRTLAGAVVEISYDYVPSSTPVTPAGAPTITGRRRRTGGR